MRVCMRVYACVWRGQKDGAVFGFRAAWPLSMTRYAPEAVADAEEDGVGAEDSLRLGGVVGPRQGVLKGRRVGASTKS